VASEPVGRQVRHLLERSRFLEQVSRARNNGKPIFAGQLLLCLPVEVEDYLVRAAHDQQGGRPDQCQPSASEVRAAAAGHDGRDR